MIDGELQFASYTREQLVEALRHIDREQYPKNFANAQAEWAARLAASAGTEPLAAESGESGHLQSPPALIRMLAAMLIAGGAAGVAVYAWVFQIAGPIENASWQIWVVSFLPLLLMAVAIATGVQLWRRDGAARSWATFLYALQIPLLEFHGYAYQFFLGFAAPVRHGPGGTNLFLQFGTTFDLGSEVSPDRFLIGVNLVAVVCLVILMAVPRSNEPVPVRVGAGNA